MSHNVRRHDWGHAFGSEVNMILAEPPHCSYHLAKVLKTSHWVSHVGWMILPFLGVFCVPRSSITPHAIHIQIYTAYTSICVIVATHAFGCFWIHFQSKRRSKQLFSSTSFAETTRTHLHSSNLSPTNPNGEAGLTPPAPVGETERRSGPPPSITSLRAWAAGRNRGLAAPGRRRSPAACGPKGPTMRRHDQGRGHQRRWSRAGDDLPGM